MAKHLRRSPHTGKATPPKPSFSTPRAAAPGWPRVQTQAAWLAEEGEKAASLLKGLRNAHAATGYERIGTLIEAMKTYLDQVNDLFAPCGSPEKALITATTFFTDVMIYAEGNAVEMAASLMKIDEQERKERPDLGTRGHDTCPSRNPRSTPGPGPTTAHGNPTRAGPTSSPPVRQRLGSSRRSVLARPRGP